MNKEKKIPILISNEEYEILDHTLHRAPQGRYCGDSLAMQSLVDADLMASVGFADWCEDEFFIITGKGRWVFRETKCVRHS